jgi:hypothetical protein
MLTLKPAKTSDKKSAGIKTAKKPAVNKKTASKSKAKKTVYIDFPKANSQVYCGHYCFRLGSLPSADWVRISINGGAWHDCRNANGYWWFDWWNFETGKFFANAIAIIDGEEVKSSTRKFKVIL